MGLGRRAVPLLKSPHPPKLDLLYSIRPLFVSLLLFLLAVTFATLTPKKPKKGCPASLDVNKRTDMGPNPLRAGDLESRPQGGAVRLGAPDIGAASSRFLHLES